MTLPAGTDKRLAQAAFRAARPGAFALEPHGAGRLAKTGGYFGCKAHSGQGGAFRQIGELKIAAFTVVNALGVVTDRNGNMAACFRNTAWPQDLKALDLVEGLPDSRKPGWRSPAPTGDARRNTTISLDVTNQTLNPADLGIIASDVMWDAILSSVPEQPAAPRVNQRRS